MLGYTIQIYVNEDGYPEWQHNREYEAQLTQAQYETAHDLHIAYQSIQNAMRQMQRIKDSNAAQRAMQEPPIIPAWLKRDIDLR